MNDKTEIVEDAIAKRLARLGAMPVDLSRLEKKVHAHVPGEKSPRRRQVWLKSLIGVAAGLLLVAMLAVALLSAPREVLASPQEMARVYDEMVEGKGVVHTTSVDQANKMIEAMAKGLVKVPEAPGTLMHSCCMRNIRNKQVACVLLNNGGQPVAMTVANASDVKSPKGAAVWSGGVEYRVERLGDLTMVMLERNGRWVCLVSKADQEALVALASKLAF